MEKIMTVTKHELSQILLKDKVPFDYFIRTNLVGNIDEKSTWKFRTSLVRLMPARNGVANEREYFFAEDTYIAGEDGFKAIKVSSDKCLEYYLENILEENKVVSSIA